MQLELRGLTLDFTMQSRWIQKLIFFSKSAFTAAPSTSTAESDDGSSTVRTESADGSSTVRTESADGSSTVRTESADRSNIVRTESADRLNIVKSSPVIHLFCTAFESTLDFNPEQCSARMTQSIFGEFCYLIIFTKFRGFPNRFGDDDKSI